MSGRRGGIPGPESRTGLTRPTMSEAEFDRRQAAVEAANRVGAGGIDSLDSLAESEPETIALTTGVEPESATARSSNATGSGRNRRVKPVSRPKRVQRMFAVEEELDKKLWLYAIHIGKDRSDVINDLLRPLVASMVLYDSRDRRAGRAAEAEAS